MKGETKKGLRADAPGVGNQDSDVLKKEERKDDFEEAKGKGKFASEDVEALRRRLEE